MNILTFENVSKGFSEKNLFENISMGIDDGTSTTSKITSKIKFTYNETREFSVIEDEIEKLENELKKLTKEMQENWADHIKIKNLTEKHAMLQEKLSEKMERWVYLNEKAEQIKSQKEK